ncbi:MAG: hypothetical protein EOP53_22285 [Sphingobacteriales bacterium]|nr:MAG: hypothetical protein EOP53_22285 [Sphingobacteriales bacterium]
MDKRKKNALLNGFINHGVNFESLFYKATIMKEQVSHFFDEYAGRFNDGITSGKPDIEAIKKCFADYFVESSPVGVMGGQNDESFEEKIPQGYKYYSKIGITAMNIISKDIKVIDEFHAMATIQWSSAYHKENGDKGLIGFEVTYFVNTKEGIKIFAYITGDEQAALKEHGLI